MVLIVIHFFLGVLWVRGGEGIGKWARTSLWDNTFTDLWELLGGPILAFNVIAKFVTLCMKIGRCLYALFI